MVEMVSQKMHEQGGHAERVRQRGTVLQDRRPVMQAGKLADNRTAQLAPKPNNTGLPNPLKTGIESLSGMSMDHVKVHYNSAQPAQLNAHAYAQGSNIHLAPGQEKHLPHEAWHVVQQAQGRVKPTMQMKGEVSVNDDAGLEYEADVMGMRALQLAQSDSNITQKKVLSFSQDLSGVAQCILRIGPPDQFIKTKEELLEKLQPLAKLLAPFVADDRLYGFASIDELTLLNKTPELVPLIRSVSFITAGRGPLEARIREWMTLELLDLTKAFGSSEINREANAFVEGLSSADSPVTVFKLALQANQFITHASREAFSLDETRNVKVNDGPGDVDDQIYGYHLTKIHNLSGIKSSGLSPKEGASKRGSLAMSTAEQRVGSEKTSKNVVAFGMHPSTFRPYVNQFEDRRQMIEGAPMELKPIMLRFKIRPEVKASALSLIKKGQVDFMDYTARNTEAPVSPKDIEVLSPTGWIRIEEYNPTDHALHEMRSGNDNARVGAKWNERTAVFTLEQLHTAGINIYAKKPEEIPVTSLGDIQFLESIRDRVVASANGITYTFRGATMQTSGNRGTWDYAFSVESSKAELPNWLQEKIRRYKTEFSDLAIIQMGLGSASSSVEASKAKVPPQVITMELLADKLTVGEASPERLNCLLDTIYQLHRNHRGSSPEGISEIREILNAVGLVPAVGMIDIYGGAGMQLANDLNLRIQIFEQTADGIVIHPIIGQSGRLVRILHTPGHFQPLWPK